MEKENLELLKWFVDFANLEAEKLQYGEKVKLTAELHLLLANGIWTSRNHSSILEQAHELHINYDEQAFRRLRELQRKFFEDFTRILGKVDDLRQSRDLEKWCQSSKVSALSSVDISPPTVTFTPKISVHLPMQVKEGKREFLYRRKPGWRENAAFLVASESDAASEAILLALFLRALNGVRLIAFARCKECNKWFLRITKRKREYCSNRCAARSSNRGRRAREKAKDTESHKQELKKGARRARKSYEKRVKKLLPGAKPLRRPQKYFFQEGDEKKP